MAISTIPEVREEIQTNINTNNNRAITGQVLQTTLVDMLDTVDDVKANTTGYYEGMSVGLADNLISPDMTEDSDSWLYRSTAGDQDVSSGFATLQKLEGNTIVWNQLVQNGDFTNGITGWNPVLSSISVVSNELTISSTSTGVCYVRHTVDAVVNHKYYIKAIAKSSTVGIVGFIQIGNKSYNFTTNGEYQLARGILEPTSVSDVFSSVFAGFTSTENGQTLLVRNICAIDLTKMFGLGSEPTVEEFEAMFGTGYYAYDAGSLLSFNPSDIETVGFNQYDNSKQTANVHVLADQKYRIKGTYSGLTYSDGTNVTVTDGYFTPDRVDYLTLSGGNDVDTCVHLSWSGWRDPVEDYEAYWKSDTDLSWIREIQYQGSPLFPNGLNGIGDVRDEVNEKQAIKRIGTVNLGDVTWMVSGNIAVPTSGGPNLTQASNYAVSTLPIYFTPDNNLPSSGKFLQIYVNGGVYFRYWYATGMTNDQVKNELKDTFLYYRLPTPIVVNFDEPKVINYKMDDFGTEELINTDSAANTPGLCKPTLVEVGYQSNLRDKIRRLDDNYVSFTTDQTETASAEEKQQARRNIDAPDKDGYYSQMHVGLADNITTPDGVTDNDEFIYRTTAGSQDVSSGYATLEKIEGHTIKWNQPCIEPNFVDLSGWNLPTPETYKSYSIQNNVLNVVKKYGVRGAMFYNLVTPNTTHKYYMSIEARVSAVGDRNQTRLGICENSGSMGSNDQIIGSMTVFEHLSLITYPRTSTSRFFIGLGDSSTPEDVWGEFKNYKLIDLTDMFGSDANIAAALNIQTTDITTATGVAAFEEWLAKNVGYKDYYPYDAGSLLSVNVNGLSTTGFNLYNNAAGTAKLPGATGTVDLTEGKYCYQITGSYSTVLDGDGTPILPNANGYFNVETPQEITVTGGDDTTCVHLCWSGYRNGDFEQYWSETLDLSFISNLKYTPEGGEETQLFPYGLCSVGDVHDEVTATKVIKRIATVDLGTLTFSAGSVTHTFGTASAPTKQYSNILSTKYTNIPGGVADISVLSAYCTSNNITYGIACSDAMDNRIYIYDGTKTSAPTEQDNWLDGVIVNYVLATPIEIDITPAQNLNYRMDDFGTEEFVSGATTTPQTAAPYPTIHYMDNLRDKIRRLDTTYVSTKIVQEFNETEKLQARENIGAGDVLSDGTYPQLTAGVANNLTGRGTVDAEYTFRASGGDADLGTGVAVIDTIKGKTLKWNQLLTNGDFSAGYSGWSSNPDQFTIDSVTDGILTGTIKTTMGAVTGISHQSFRVTQNHRYYIGLNIKLNSQQEGTNNLRVNGYEGTIGISNIMLSFENNKWNRVSGITIATRSCNSNLRLYIEYQAIYNPHFAVGDTIQYRNIFFVDLTEMFGSGNEPSTAEEFENLYPLDYYPYTSTPILINNTASGITTVGFNQWDEEWELGRISAVDGSYETSTGIRSKNFIRVFPNTQYYGVAGRATYVICYDINKDFVLTTWQEHDPAGAYYKNINGSVFTIPNGIYYIKFYQTSVTSYDHDTCINLSWSGYRNGEYEPYEEHTLYFNGESGSLATLTGRLLVDGEPTGESVTIFPDGMKSVGSVYDFGKADSDGYIRKVTKRIGSVDLGSLTWGAQSATTSGGALYMMRTTNLYDKTKATANNGTVGNILCPKYSTITAEQTWLKYTGISVSNYAYIDVYDPNYNTGASTTAFKAAMSGVMLYYELATPEEYLLDTPIYANYLVNDFGTERRIPDDTSSNVNAPISYSVKYAMNATDTIRRLGVNYIRKSSMDNILSAFVTAGIIGSYTLTYNATNDDYNCTVTAPTPSE